MRKVQDDLDGLPLSFSDNPQAKLLSLCADFISEIDQNTNGSPNQPTFFQDIDKEFWKFNKEIMSTRVGFEISPGSTQPAIVSLPTREPAIPVLAPSFLPAGEVLEAPQLESNVKVTQTAEGKIPLSLSVLIASHLSQFCKGYYQAKVNPRVAWSYSFFGSRVFDQFIGFEMEVHLFKFFR
jgi:hypothetical protein